MTRRRDGHRGRRGSALVLVLVMTLSMAGLAVSAVLLSSSSSFIQRYYDKDKDFRFAARAMIGLVKSRMQRDTLVSPDSIPRDTAYRAFTASTIADASGGTSSTIRVNGYATYTGDTAGTYIPFLTIMAQAYDTNGTRSVQRLDLQSEAFSRYALIADSFATTLNVGQHLHGRTHTNRTWQNTGTSPGPDLYDTLTAVTSVTGTANYHGYTAVTGAKRIRWPQTTSHDISLLSTLATAGNLSFTPVSGSSQARCSTTPLVDLSGQATSTIGFCFGGVAYTGGFVAINAIRGTRLRFRPIDVNHNGSYESSEGFFEVFDLAAGMDTASIRVDIPKATGSALNMVTVNQCGLMMTNKNNGRKEFFPVARFREKWVRARLYDSASAPAVTAADTNTMGFTSGSNYPNNAALNKILSYGVGYSRCFPAGSPYLMLTERNINSATCAIDSSTAVTPYGWGAPAACSAQRYGGQDTTFTANVRRCEYHDDGLCDAAQVRLGSWRAFGGTNTAAPPATVIQAVETPYLWPISSTYNSASRGVIASTAGPLYVSDTLRGYATLYVGGVASLINDVVYDRDPTMSDALCRNFLGIVTSNGIRIANNALNNPRPDQAGTFRFLGTPNFTLNAVVLTLSSSFTVEDSTATQALSTPLACNGTNTSGGCINIVGGVAAKIYRNPYTPGTANSGMIFNRTADPCQNQATNRRPPFFPLTGRFVDYKSYDVDPRTTDTWTKIKTYLARLRGNNRAVP